MGRNKAHASELVEPEMSGPTDIMAWMQKAYIDAHPAPWYRKIALRVKLFIELRFKKVKGTPGAALVDEVLDAAKAKSKRALYQSAQPANEARTRASIARMWDSL
jgi:hypothetical protein